LAFRSITTRYGAAALETLRQVVGELKGSDPMAPVTVLVPNTLAGIVARRTHATGLGDGGRGVAGLVLTTLPRLAEGLGAAGLHPRRPATTAVVSAGWRAALASGPSLFDPVKEHPATIRALVAAHRELRDLTDAGLAGVASASPLAAELVRLHRRVTTSLGTRWYDQTDLLHAAASRLGDGAVTVDRPMLYLPQQLIRSEAGLLAALAATTEVPVVVGRTGVVRADRAVIASLERVGISAGDRDHPPPTASEVLHASDSDDEVRCVVRDLVATLAAGTAAHRVAVLYGSPVPYSRLLHEHLNASGIAVNGAGTRPVLERSLGRSYLDVLELAGSDVPRAAFFTAVSEAPVRTFDGGRVPASRWERLSREAAVVGGDDWDRRLTGHARVLEAELAAQEASDDPYPPRLDGLRRELEAVGALRRFAITLSTRLAAGAEAETWTALSSWAMRLFADLYGDESALAQLPAEEQYAAVTVESVLRGLGQLDAVEPVAGLDALVTALALELEAALPRVGRFGDGVLVAPLSAAVGLDADVVYVLGLAEDAYPGRLAEDALLLETTRDLSGGELASYRDRLDAKHRHLLAAFDAAPRVVASFPRGDLRRSTGRLPSRWLLSTLRELSGDHRLAATRWAQAAYDDAMRSSPSYATSLLRAPLPVSEQEWRTQIASTGRRLEDDTVAGAMETIAARASDRFTRFDGNLSGAEGLPDFARSDRLVSPTALEAYATCPHAYFVERMLRVRPVDQPEEIVTISPLDIGSLIHEAMDRFITEFADTLPGFGAPWSPAHRQRLREIALDLADDYERRGTTGHPSLWLVERDRILNDLAYMLDDDEERRRRLSARVVRSELSVGFPGEEPVEVPVPRGVVRFRGSADKVDERRDGTLLVIDVKTGGTSRYKVIRKDPLAAGTKLQLPVYARAARQLLGAERAEAAYWFVRQGKRDWIEVELTDEFDVDFRRAVATLTDSIAAGLFPAKAPEQADSVWVQCPFCNPDGLGHGDVRARWERKRHDPALRALVALVDPAAVEPR
jgi:RecB family exonuclease